MMNDIGKRISEARLKKNLTIEQLSDITKVRHNIIEAIEAGDFSVMPEIYMKSFIKTINKYLQISETEKELSIENKPVKNAKLVIDDEVILSKPKEIPKLQKNEILPVAPIKNIHKQKAKNEEVEKYAELFKKKNVKKVSRVGLINYLIYSILAIVVIAAIVITLLNFEKNENDTSKKSINNTDTLEVQQPKNTLLSYFEKPDTLIVTAKANDTSWVRVVIDGRNYLEVLMKPGQEEKWGASQFFVIDQGNVGSINFYRNGELLPMFGKPGTVVKNIKITKDNVLNTSLKKDTLTIQNQITPKKKRIIKKEPEKPKIPKLIQESQIPTTPNPLKRNNSD